MPIPRARCAQREPNAEDLLPSFLLPARNERLRELEVLSGADPGPELAVELVRFVGSGGGVLDGGGGSSGAGGRWRGGEETEDEEREGSRGDEFEVGCRSDDGLEVRADGDGGSDMGLETFDSIGSTKGPTRDENEKGERKDSRHQPAVYARRRLLGDSSRGWGRVEKATNVPQNEPKLETSELPSERELPVPIVDHESGISLFRSEVFGSEGESGGEERAVSDPETGAVKVDLDSTTESVLREWILRWSEGVEEGLGKGKR
jgi:hypothetical protein